MRALAPWTESNLRREVDRLFERFFESPWAELPALGDWHPALDLAEGKDAFTVKAELPGVDPKEITISLEGNTLTLRGEKEQTREEKDERKHRTERSWGAFVRSITLPGPVEAGQVAATFKNGVVTVTLPKAAGSRGTTIPIKAA